MRCRYCGCTEFSACLHKDGEPCAWYQNEYCTACQEKFLLQLGNLAAAFEPDVGRVENIGGWPVMIEARPLGGSMGWLTVEDHIGAVVLQLEPDGIYVAPQYQPEEIAQLLGGKLEVPAHA